MQTDLKSLSNLFTERIFRIPDYQRGYSWEEHQLLDFWNDLSLLEAGRHHYTGVLTLEEVPSEKHKQWDDDLWLIASKNYQPFYVVDGQQRLTTSLILINELAESLAEGQELNYTGRDEIRKRFIFEPRSKGLTGSYVFGYEKDNPSYEYLKVEIFRGHLMAITDRPALPIQRT